MDPDERDGSGIDPELMRRAKVSPHLRAAAAEWERSSKEAQSAEGERAVAPVAPEVRVLIELARPDTSELQKSGLAFEHLFGLFYVAKVSLDRLDDLARLDSILRIHHEQGTAPTLDDSIPDIRASTVRNPQYPFSGTDKYTGLGVIVGIIDSGINILHPVFRLPNDQTKTRIRAILDQTQTPSVTYRRLQIQAAIAANTQIIQPGNNGKNDHKHGTHVAGIAAGNGKKAGNCAGEFKYVGVAPEADLVIVKYSFGGPPDVLAAIQFIAAAAAGMPPVPNVGDAEPAVPCVINMSFGSSIGPHDGTDPLDQVIDNYLLGRAALPPPAKPVVLVAAAGNEGGHAVPGAGIISGGDDSHATGTIPPGNVVKRLHYTLRADTTSTGQLQTVLDIRFTATNGVGCRLIPPGNKISGPNIAAPDAPTVVTFTETNQTSVCSITPSPVPGGAPGSRRIVILVTSTASGKNQPGEWVLELTNAGAAPITYHAWVTGSQFERFTDDLSRTNTTNAPGSSASVITVGNHASSGKSKGEIADSSSRGPRLDGLQKPDLSAPGVDICSAKRDLYIGCCCDCCCDSYIDESGTSMSTPHVTGAIALILQRNPALTHQQIKNILIANARHDSYTGPNPNNDFGAGKLDVLACLNDPLVRGTGTVLTSMRTVNWSTPRLPASAVPPVAELPPLPQIQEGTPLWRLLNTAEGRRLYELGRVHWEEVRALVNTQKRVAVVWHRNQGPMLLHHVTRAVMLPHVALPLEWDGVEVSVRAACMVSALEPYASMALRQAMHETLPLIAQLQGKTLLELVEMFESSDELQHA